MTHEKLLSALINATRLIGITRQEMIAMTGWSRETVSKWYKGKRSPALEQYVDWADALGFDVVLVRKGQNVISGRALPTGKYLEPRRRAP